MPLEFRVGDSQNRGQPDCTAGGRGVGKGGTGPRDCSHLAHGQFCDCCYVGEEADRQLSSSQQLTCACSQTELPAPSTSSSLPSPCSHAHAAAGKMASVHSPHKKRLCWGPPGTPLSTGVQDIGNKSHYYQCSVHPSQQSPADSSVPRGSSLPPRALFSRVRFDSEAGCTWLSPDSSH